MGLSGLFYEFFKSDTSEISNFIALQNRHVSWQGFHLHDLIFPMFMFISGISLVYSIKNQISKSINKTKIARKIIRRGLTLVLLGTIYNGLGYVELSNLRIASVLGQIGLAYMFASLIVLYFPCFKAQIKIFGGLLLVYALIQLFLPMPGWEAGNFTKNLSINAYFDQLLLPGRLYGGKFDPEGLLCIISSIGTTLGGSLVANILLNEKYNEIAKIKIILMFGLGSIVLALAISPFYPIIKQMWTSSFSLLCIGISCIYFSLFYYIIDVKQFNKWTYLFKIIGVNSITIYQLNRFIPFNEVSNSFFKNLSLLFGSYSYIIIALGAISIQLLILNIMNKKKIFLKV
jgi:predicted acyltransferase